MYVDLRWRAALDWCGVVFLCKKNRITSIRFFVEMYFAMGRRRYAPQSTEKPPESPPFFFSAFGSALGSAFG